jgi:flagellar assembly protein FliH
VNSMSSRVRPPDDNAGVEAISWRQVYAAAPKQGAASVEEPPDSAQRIAQMQKQCDQRVTDAQAAGQREGEATGRARAAAELQPAIDRMARAIEEIGGLRARLRAEAEADLVTLSLAIARRVLRRELAIDPDALHGLVLGALDKLHGQEICKVRVHPSHAGLVSNSLRQNSASAHVEVISDPSREVGAIIFETQRGNLDASVESQLQEIERGLADRLRRQA